MGNYIEEADVLAEGVTGVSTTRINNRITKWESIVEKVTGNIFYVYEPGELTFDGSNMKYLHFNIPLIEVSALKINGNTEELDTQYYRSYTGITPIQDDRQNPKIELKDTTGSIFSRSAGVFIRGEDQKVTAKWGYVDPHPTTPGSYVTPDAIKGALVSLVVKDLDGYFDQFVVGGSGPVTPLRREKTDGHELEYQMTEDIKFLYASIPREIYEVLMMFRTPMKVAVPDPRRFLSLPAHHRIMSF